MRKIIHIDMDAFYAAIEQRDYPKLKNKPLIIGGPPNSRSVVCTCSYQARKYGVASAMPSSLAYRLCPQAIFIEPDFAKYQLVSQQIHQIFKNYTDLVEPLSLDEAYLDVTAVGNFAACEIAEKIKKQIKKELALTASAGVSYNKFLAKLASEFDKPNGLKIISPSEALSFLEQLPIGKFYGVGKVTEQKMLSLGITFGKDLKKFSRTKLKQIFGKNGEFFYLAVRGIDDRPVINDRVKKSISKEHTLATDLSDCQQMKAIIKKIAMEVAGSLKNYQAQTICLKVKFSNFSQISRCQTISESTADPKVIAEVAVGLLSKALSGKQSVRLLGITVSKLNFGK